MESEIRHEARQVPSWLIFDVSQMSDRYRTIWRRIAAGLLAIAIFAPARVVGAAYYQDSFGSAIGYAWGIGMCAASAAFGIYFHGRYGATPGKSIMGCRVVTSTREVPIRIRNAFVRELPLLAIGLASVFEGHWAKAEAPRIAAAIGYSAHIWFYADMAVALFHPKRRALHDLIAGTVVVKNEPNKAPEPTSCSVTPRAIVPLSE